MASSLVAQAQARARRAASNGHGAMGLHGRLHSRPGYCNTTEGDEPYCQGSQGSWETEDLQDCLEMCHRCERCRFISFSKKFSDCSWFRQCSLDRLHTKQSKHHTTYRVRSADGTV